MFLRLLVTLLFMIWTGSKQKLLNVMSDSNKKHPQSDLNSSIHKQKLGSYMFLQRSK